MHDGQLARDHRLGTRALEANDWDENPKSTHPWILFIIRVLVDPFEHDYEQRSSGLERERDSNASTNRITITGTDGMIQLFKRESRASIRFLWCARYAAVSPKSFLTKAERIPSRT